MGVVGERLIQTGGYDHVRAVDGGEHTTDDDGTEHRTHLVGGLRNRRCRTRLTRRYAREHQVVRDGLGNTDTGTEHDEDQDNDRVAVRAKDREHRKRGTIQQQTKGHNLRRVEVRRDAHNHQASDDSRNGAGNHQDTGVHGCQA